MTPQHDAWRRRLSLSPRALDLCRRMGRCRSPKEIAQELGISRGRVYQRIRVLCQKLGARPLDLAVFGYCLSAAEASEREESANCSVPLRSTDHADAQVV